MYHHSPLKQELLKGAAAGVLEDEEDVEEEEAVAMGSLLQATQTPHALRLTPAPMIQGGTGGGAVYLMVQLLLYYHLW